LFLLFTFIAHSIWIKFCATEDTVVSKKNTTVGLDVGLS
jgi:hypothetical protein